MNLKVSAALPQASASCRAAELRSQFMDAMSEAEIDDTKSDVERLAESAKAATEMHPLAQIKAELIQAVVWLREVRKSPGINKRAGKSPL